MTCEGKKAEEFKIKAGALGCVPGLASMRRLMAELGDVQDKLTVIHIAGTNGKGSVSAMLERALRLAGYRTGRYNSPAVFFEEEKFQVNGEPIGKEELDGLFCEIAGACERMTARGFAHPTLFEAETAAAFLWFYRQKCEIVLLEAGLGGAMDATNIIKKPLLSVLTSISMDHMALLGDTLVEIAGQKAGIIKEGCPVVTARQRPEVYEVLARVCRKRRAPLFGVDAAAENSGCAAGAGKESVGVVFTAGAGKELAGVDCADDAGKELAGVDCAGGAAEAASGPVRYEDGYLCFDWKNYSHLRLSLLGAYQVENGMCAVRTLEVLGGLGFPVKEEVMREGLRTTVWPGRFEVLSRSPLLVADGAHNADAADKLRRTLELGFTNYRIIYIIGVLRDKEHEKILKCLLPLAEKVYTVTPDSPRALSGEELCREAGKFHGDVSCAGSVREALEQALKQARAWETAGEPERGPAGRSAGEPERGPAGRSAGAPGRGPAGRSAGEPERGPAGRSAGAPECAPAGRPPMILAFGSLSYLGELKQEFEKIRKP